MSVIPSASTNDTIATSQLDGQSQNGGRNSASPEETIQAVEEKFNNKDNFSNANKAGGTKEGGQAVQLGKQQAIGRGGTSASKGSAAASTDKSVVKSVTGDQALGNAQSQNALKSSSSSNNNAHSSSRGDFGITTSRIGDHDPFPARIGPQQSGNQTGASNRPGCMLQPGGGMLPSSDSWTSHQALPLDHAGSHNFVSQAGLSSRSGGAYQLPGAMTTFGPVQADYQSRSQASHSLLCTSQDLVGNDSQSVSPNAAASITPLTNGQWGSREFDNQKPTIPVPVPSYTHSLPLDQQKAIHVAANTVSGWLNGWLRADMHKLNSILRQISARDAADVVRTINSQQPNHQIPMWPYLSIKRSVALNPSRDFAFYQTSFPNNDARTSQAASGGASSRDKASTEDPTGSEASYTSFDMTPYSLQTGDEGRLFDSKFELATPHSPGNRLIAGINCPENVLQKCDLKRNPRWTASIERRDRLCRAEWAIRVARGKPGPSQQQVGISSGPASASSPIHFTDPISQPPQQPRFAQRISRGTCDNHDCGKGLRVDFVICARCHRARYCDKSCQIFTWLLHLPTCNLHPDANAREVTALETWATQRWKEAVDTVEISEKEKGDAPMDVDGEDIDEATAMGLNVEKAMIGWV